MDVNEQNTNELTSIKNSDFKSYERTDKDDQGRLSIVTNDPRNFKKRQNKGKPEPLTMGYKTCAVVE